MNHCFPLMRVVLVAIACGHPAVQGAPAGSSEPASPPRVRTDARALPRQTDRPVELKWDAETKTYDAKPGESSAGFVFNVTNVSKSPVSITALHTSCGCLVAELPPLPHRPFVLAPGSSVALGAVLEFAAKAGTMEKTIVVESSVGFSPLRVRVNVPPQPDAGALKN